MKKIITIFVLLSLLLGLSSCKNEPNAYELLSDFVNSYGAEGIIYSPLISEGEKGYMPSGMVERIYIFCGNLPRNFAVFLNSHADSRSECGVFVCSDAAQCQIVEEACLESGRCGQRNGYDHRGSCCKALLFVQPWHIGRRDKGENGAEPSW